VKGTATSLFASLLAGREHDLLGLDLFCACSMLYCCVQGLLPGATRGLNAAAGHTALGAKRAPASQLNTPSPFVPAHQQPLQVLLRLRVIKPNTHNTQASLQMNLAGLLLNAKSDGGDELLNLTVDTVQCAVLKTTRQRQLSLGVLSVQLDNQLLATRHPVVLSPASLAEVGWGIWGCTGDRLALFDAAAMIHLVTSEVSGPAKTNRPAVYCVASTSQGGLAMVSLQARWWHRSWLAPGTTPLHQQPHSTTTV